MNLEDILYERLKSKRKAVLTRKEVNSLFSHVSLDKKQTRKILKMLEDDKKIIRNKRTIYIR